MPIFDNLQQASFAGYKFPVSEVEVTGSLRDHVHEYPHAHGGAPEKMGRRLYTVKMVGIFESRFKKYPNLWPMTLNYLRMTFEQGNTEPLVIPTIGTIQAYCRNWSQQQTSKSRSGETASFEFVEDQGSDALVEGVLTGSALVEVFGTYNAAMLKAEFAKEADIGVFDAVSNAVNAVLAVGDTIDAVGNLVSAKFLALSDMCASADATLTAQDPRNHPLTEALKNIWDTARNEQQDRSAALRLGTYVTPYTTALSNIATSIYGDASRTVELMQLNPIDDVFKVRAGTKVKYVDDSSTTFAF